MKLISKKQENSKAIIKKKNISIKKEREGNICICKNISDSATFLTYEATPIKTSCSIKGHSKKNQITWKNNLSKDFLAEATKNIVKYNRRRQIPIIYAKDGIIYKELESKVIKIGIIQPLKRRVVENNYSIDYIN